MRVTPSKITSLGAGEVFVFGSNIRGIHGLGAAKDAVKFGAKSGHYMGICGSTYAIPTKDRNLETFSIEDIRIFVEEFVRYVKLHPEKIFLVTPIGCGLAGLEARQIAPMFSECVNLENVYLPNSFLNALGVFG